MGITERSGSPPQATEAGLNLGALLVSFCLALPEYEYPAELPLSLLVAVPGSIWDAESHLWKGTGRPVGVEEDAPGRAPRCNQRETTWSDAIFEQPLSFAEHQRKDPDAIFVDEFGGDQRLQQFAAAPNMQRRPIRCLQPADLVHDMTADVLRALPVELVEAARDDVFRRLVERLRNRVVALVRPVGGEDLVGPASQKHVELTRDSLANGLVQGVVQEGHGPASVGEPVPRILLGAAGRLHDAVQRDLGDCNDLSHHLSLLRRGHQAGTARRYASY